MTVSPETKSVAENEPTLEDLQACLARTVGFGAAHASHLLALTADANSCVIAEELKNGASHLCDDGRLKRYPSVLRVRFGKHDSDDRRNADADAARRYTDAVRALVAEHLSDDPCVKVRPLFTTLRSIERDIFGKEGELQNERPAVRESIDPQIGNPSSSALATDAGVLRSFDQSVASDGPKREPVTADSKGQPRADEASRAFTSQSDLQIGDVRVYEWNARTKWLVRVLTLHERAGKARAMVNTLANTNPDDGFTFHDGAWEANIASLRRLRIPEDYENDWVLMRCGMYALTAPAPPTSASTGAGEVPSSSPSDSGTPEKQGSGVPPAEVVLPYEAISVNGRAMEWKEPLWAAIQRWAIAPDLDDKAAWVVEVENAVEVAMRIAVAGAHSSRISVLQVRVTELQAANTNEVERRREAERVAVERSHRLDFFATEIERLATEARS